MHLLDPSLRQQSEIVIPDINKIISSNMNNLHKLEDLIDQCE